LQPLSRSRVRDIPIVEGSQYWDVPLSDEVQTYMKQRCIEEGVPERLVLAIIKHESGFNPNTISATNDYGLMQINRSNHSKLGSMLGISDWLDPYGSIDAGLWLLGNYVERYDDLDLVLMCYNFGEGGAGNKWNQGVYSTDYSKRVIASMDSFTYR
jgi:soluble lytic murein transglycosylase-like protein